MIPVRRTETIADDLEKGTNVFVPSLMGAGVLLSLGVFIADTVNKIRGDKGRVREVEVVADYITRDVLRSIHRDAQVPAGRGLRTRRTYVLTAMAFIGLGLYGLVGSFWNFVNPVDDGWVEDIAWVWAISLVVVAVLLSIGVTLAIIAWRYPDVPPWARLWLARTPIGAAPDSES